MKISKAIKHVDNMWMDTYEEGESIEQKVKRMVEEKEPIKDSAPMIYTEKKDGVIAGYDIRTDRWDIAISAMDKVAAANIARSKATYAEPADVSDVPNKLGGGTPSEN